MEDINCPYCDASEEINHADGYGYEEGTVHQQECGSCGKTYGFTTSISFYYEGQKLPCANGEIHEWRPTRTAPKCFTKMTCKHCEERREPTPEEKKEHQIHEHWRE